MPTANDHIIRFLEYYIDKGSSPGFAVLLNGNWGCGKTWFIDNYLNEKYGSDKGRQYLKASLFGVSTIAEIEDQC